MITLYISIRRTRIFIPVFCFGCFSGLLFFFDLFGSFSVFQPSSIYPETKRRKNKKKSIQLEMIIIRLCSGLLFGLFGCCCSGWFICLFVWNFGRHCLTIPLHTYSTRYTHRISLSFSCFEFHSIQFCVWIILLSQCFSIR